MYCPKCRGKTKVTDSRAMRNKNGIRRRRQCQVCGHSFTTYEVFEQSLNIEELISLRLNRRKALLNLAIVEDILRGD